MLPRLATPYDGKPKVIEHAGLSITVQHDQGMTGMLKARNDILADRGISDEKWDAMSDSAQQAVVGKAMVGTMVLGIADAEFPMPDGQDPYLFRFNEPSDVSEYDTVGEELLGRDGSLQKYILSFCLQVSNFKNMEEAKTVKKSLTPSPSTAPSTGQPAALASAG